MLDMRKSPSNRNGLTRRVCFAYLILGILLSSCGYRFAGGDLPFSIKTLCIRMFENPTTEAGIETTFANDLINEFTRNSHVILAGPEEADAILTGEIRSMSIETVSRKSSYVPFERQAKIAVDLRLKDRDGQVVWSGDEMSEEEAYTVMPEKLATEHNRREAISAISERLAEEVYARVSGGF